jgi:hypothetical protein
MQPQSVDSPQNKELLWDTLQESGAFAGLVQSQFQPVQSAFDRTVSSAARFSSSMSLNDANKRIIRDFVQVLQQLRQSGQSKPAHQPAHQPIELVYRAEDLQNERASEFDRNLREKQAEMDAFLTLKKPADVNFSDTSKGVLDDKPIGDEMSRLIAQELAARERELVQLKPEDIKKAQQWLGATATTTATMPIPITTTKPNNAQAQAQAQAQNVVIKKSVSFSEEEYEMEQMEQMDENFEEMDIFAKFKKLNTTESETIETETIETETETIESETIETGNVDSNVVSMQQIYTKLLELEERMNANHAEIMERLNRVPF